MQVNFSKSIKNVKTKAESDFPIQILICVLFLLRLLGIDMRCGLDCALSCFVFLFLLRLLKQYLFLTSGTVVIIHKGNASVQKCPPLFKKRATFLSPIQTKNQSLLSLSSSFSHFQLNSFTALFYSEPSRRKKADDVSASSYLITRSIPNQ